MTPPAAPQTPRTRGTPNAPDAPVAPDVPDSLNEPAIPRAPALRRRLAALLYEGVLLFGVVWLVGFVYGVATNQRHALQGALGLKAALFFTLGLYFVYFWSRHGQTLAMRTWHLRVVGPDGRPPGAARATARYLFGWLWFVPALAIVGASGLAGGGAITAVALAGMLAYALLARLRGDRQFLHDVLSGTRIVDARPLLRDAAR